eukprot:EG_transcript_313
MPPPRSAPLWLLLLLLWLPRGTSGDAWPAAYDSYEVELERFPLCGNASSLTGVAVRSDGNGTVLSVINATATEDSVVILGPDQLRNCSAVPATLPASPIAVVRPGAPVWVPHRIYFVALWFAVAVPADGGAPLACADLGHPDAGTYGFGAEATVVGADDRVVAYYTVFRLSSYGSMLYGSAVPEAGRLTVYLSRCAAPRVQELFGMTFGPAVEPDTFVSAPLASLTSRASVVVSWTSANGTLSACGDITIGEETCLTAVAGLPFYLFLLPFLLYVPLALCWGCVRYRRKLCCRGGAGTTSEKGEVDLTDIRSVEGTGLLSSPLGGVECKQYGFRSSCIGQALRWLYVVLSLWILVLVVFVCLDYYGSTPYGVPRCLFGTTALEWWMLYTWFLHAFWYGFLVLKYHTVRNFFRSACSLENAEEVMMWRPKEVESFVAKSHPLVRLIRAVTSRLGVADTAVVEFVPVQRGPFGRYVVYQYQRLHWHEDRCCYVPRQVVLPDTHEALLALSDGLTEEEAVRRRELVGPNAIPMKVPSWWTVAGNEFCSPFYVYQFMMTWLYYYWAYWNVAVAFTALILLSGLLSMWVLRSNAKSLAQLANVDTVCQLRRSGKWVEAHNASLVPGDVIQIGGDGWVVPCDALVLSGTCLMDEAGLTGESMPQQKVALPPDNPKATFQPEKADKKHCLFAGTACLRSVDRAEPAKAVVLTTGMNTSKGKLLSTILWPKELRFTFDEHATVVIFLLCCFTALIFTINTSIKMFHSKGHISIPTLFLYATSDCCQILSPLIPALLLVGQTAAAARLRRRSIYCVNPRRVTVAGKIKCLCFDKTGTLTKSGLDFAGPCPVVDGSLAPSPVAAADLASIPSPLLHAMVTCHTVTCWDGRLVGNEVEVNMFAATGWTLEEEPGRLPRVTSPTGDSLGLLRRLEFDHGRMTMTVAVEVGSKVMSFTKGSFERIRALCRPETVPEEYSATCQVYAAQGFYTLAVGCRTLHSAEEAAMMSRDELEGDLALLGLLLFRNEPKPDAAEAVAELKRGATRVVMITGDTVLTGIAIARSVGLLEGGAAQKTVLVDAANTTLQWHEVGPSGLPEPTTEDEAKVLLRCGAEAAVTGAAFQVLGPDITSEKIVNSPGGLLLKTRVFGRMSPEQKVECVEFHMGLGLVTGMCGDGGNDAGALRAAHAGIALSDAEASIVSPFTSKSRTVMSVVDVMREGRCALCTSFAAVKYQIMYGVILAGNEIIENYYQTLMSEWHWIYLDGVVSMLVSVALTLAQPEKSLAPTRPTASLLAPVHLASYAIQAAVHGLTTPLVIVWCRSRDFFVPFDASGLDEEQWWKFTRNYEGTVIFTLICMEVLAAGAAFSLGGAYRTSLLLNWPFLLIWGLVLAGVFALLVPNGGWLADLFAIASSETVMEPCGSVRDECYDECMGRPHAPMPQWFRVALLLVCVGNILAVVLLEKLLLAASTSPALRQRFPSNRLSVRF